MSCFGPTYLDTIFDLVPTILHEGLKKMFLGYLERSLPGREAEMVDRIMTLDLDNARPIMRILAAVKKPGATDALRKLAGCANPYLRCDAIALLSASPEQLKDELGQLAESPQADLRVAALRTLAYHQCKPAGPLLVRKMQDATFQKLGIEERREMLQALYLLHPVRAEAVSDRADLQARRLLHRRRARADARARRRATSAGRRARWRRSRPVIAATKRRPWNSQLLRDKATAAAEAIAARMGKRLTESGDLQ